MQLITPQPNIACTPGWCLQYVREAFGITPGVYPTATSGWGNAEFKHEDWDFPDAWVPLWFAMDGVPAGHVVVRSPDGRVWSTTNAGQYTPRIHPSVQDLLDVYARAGLALTYRGWSEDIETVRIWEDDEMAVSEERFAAMEYKVNALFDAFFNKKGSKKGDNKSIVGGEAIDDLINKNDLLIRGDIAELRKAIGK